MPTVNKDYRENPDRAIYVLGKIGQEMVLDLTPKINAFRVASSDPITVYIDSPGGYIAFAENIRCLAKTPNQDGGRCRLITVVTGTAASAAADFLALGDYAIAHPHTEIIYHGSRQPLGQEMTFEWASMLAASLQETNERFALRLARHSFSRIIWRVLQLKGVFQNYRNGTARFGQLIDALKEKFLGENREVLEEALAKQRIIRDLSMSVGKHLKRFKNVDSLVGARFEAELLKGIVNYRTRIHKGDGWKLSKNGLQEVGNDFNLLHDFYYGSQTRHLDPFVDMYGILFLSPEELGELKALKEGDQKKKFLRERGTQKLQPLWYFVVSLCRLLQTRDYRLTPEEAYWMGVVDEVPGSGLPNQRESVENLEALPSETSPGPAKTEASSVPA